MTPEQKPLARHALGLDSPQCKNRSYRNRYFAPFGSPSTVLWDGMIEAGEAKFHPNTSGRALYSLTRKGAELALEKGESLDPEDFPE